MNATESDTVTVFSYRAVSVANCCICLIQLELPCIKCLVLKTF